MAISAELAQNTFFFVLKAQISLSKGFQMDAYLFRPHYLIANKAKFILLSAVLYCTVIYIRTMLLFYRTLLQTRRQKRIYNIAASIFVQYITITITITTTIIETNNLETNITTNRNII